MRRIYVSDHHDLDGPAAATFGVMFGSMVLSFTVLTMAFRRAAPREHQFVPDILAPEVEAGVVTTEEIEAVVDKKARKAYRMAAPNHQVRRARGHLRRAILDLTHDVAGAKGFATDAVKRSRTEVARLRAAAEPT